MMIQDGKLTDLASTGPMLGMLNRCDFETSSLPLDPGTQLVVYTDGAYEIDLGNDVQLPFETFRDMLLRSSVDEHVSRSLFGRLTELNGSSALDDDFAMLDLKFS